MVIRAGDLRDVILIQQGTETNTAGAVTTAWSTFKEVRAFMMPQRASEYWTASQIADRIPVKFQIRYLSGLTSKMRILHNYQAYEIYSVEDIRNRHIEMIIHTFLYPDPIPDNFVYSNLTAVDDGTETGNTTVTWTTDFYSDTQTFYLKQGESIWSQDPAMPADTNPRVLSHSNLTGPFDYDTSYTIKVRGYNDDGRTPGYSDSITVNVSVAGKVEIAS